jgi:NAD(P)H-flavin reductase
VAVVRMEIVDGGLYTFEAGQFATLTFANGLSRDFSMASRERWMNPLPRMEVINRWLNSSAVT